MSRSSSLHTSDLTFITCSIVISLSSFPLSSFLLPSLSSSFALSLLSLPSHTDLSDGKEHSLCLGWTMMFVFDHTLKMATEEGDVVRLPLYEGSPRRMFSLPHPMIGQSMTSHLTP